MTIFRVVMFYFMLHSFAAHAVSVGDKIANFSLPEFKTSSKTFSLSDYDNHVIYIDFWASWCVPCRKSFPFMNRLHEEYSAQGLKVIAINMDEEPNDAVKFLEKYPAKFSVLQGSDELGKYFNLKGLPMAYLVTKTGELVAIHAGFNQKHASKVEAQIQHLIKE